MNKEELKEVLREELAARSPVDKEAHIKHHKFLDIFIEEYENNKNLKQQVKRQVIGWGVISILSGIGYAVYHYIEHFIQGGN